MRTSRIVSVAASAFIMQLTATSFAQPEAAPPPPPPGVAPAPAPAPAPAAAPATPTTPTTPETTPATAPAPAPAPAVAPAPAEPAPAEPAAPAAPVPVAAEAEQADTDHNMMIGRVAFGFLGTRSMGIAGGQPPGISEESVEAPVIGIRYWLAGSIGLDLGLGIYTSSGSQDDNIGGVSTSDDLVGTNAVLIHAGVPLALAGSQHFSFQITPETNVGLSGSTEQDAGGGPDIDRSGFHFDVGARIGSEVHWGFIGIPELSLQGSVGVRLDIDSYSASAGQDESTRTHVVFATDTYDDPWDAFTGSIAALYYF